MALSVIIVGAGPSGLLLARQLAQAGISQIQVLERDSTTTEQHRAIFYQSPSIQEFKKAHIWDEVKTVAEPLKSVCWRDGTDDGKRLFGMKVPADDTVLMNVNTLMGVIRKKIEQSKQGEILFNHKVIDVGQDNDTAWVNVETPEGAKRMEASYVVACDGADSTVRKSVFGPGALHGLTWDKQLVAADIRCTMTARFPDIEDSNIFFHPEKAWILFRLPQDTDKWRVIYQDSAPKDEQLLATAAESIKQLLASGSDAPEFELIAARPYQIHQRCVSEMVKGRIILAADAAHLCCPYGALGLNGGIADVGSLADCLGAIHDGRADADILQVYSDVRREKWHSQIDPVSQRTMKLVYSDPKSIIPDHPLYKMCKMLENNPEAQKKMPSKSPVELYYDFTPHFKSAIE